TLDSYTTTATHHEFTGHIEEAHPAKKGLKLHLVDMEKGSSDQSHYIKLTPKVEGNQWTASIEHREALTPGDHYLLLASSRDAVGNLSSDKLRFDLKAPEVKEPEPSETPEPAIPVPVNLVLDGLPKLTHFGKTLSISGHAKEGSTVAVEMGGQAFGTVTAHPNNTWELLISPEQLKDLPEGAMQVNIRASLNGVTDQTSATITVDKTAPQVTLDSDVSTDSIPSFTGTIQEAHPKTFEAKLLNSDGQVIDTLTVTYPTEGKWTATGTQPQSTGSDYQLLLTAEDQLGQKSTLQKTCSVQPTAESGSEAAVDLGLTLTKPPEWINLQKTLKLSGSAKEGSQVSVTIAGHDFGTATADTNNAWKLDISPESLQAALSGQEGVKDVLVTASLGEDKDSKQDQVGIDTTGPVVTLDSYTTTATHHEFTGHIEEAHPAKKGLKLHL
uniref:hypothetical protein n=1 Tax=Endozoicomonas arenosclerae TaxID=1633495 RepID=UPI000A7370CC